MIETIHNYPSVPSSVNYRPTACFCACKMWLVGYWYLELGIGKETQIMPEKFNLSFQQGFFSFFKTFFFGIFDHDTFDL